MKIILKTYTLYYACNILYMPQNCGEYQVEGEQYFKLKKGNILPYYKIYL